MALVKLLGGGAGKLEGGGGGKAVVFTVTAVGGGGGKLGPAVAGTPAELGGGGREAKTEADEAEVDGMSTLEGDLPGRAAPGPAWIMLVLVPAKIWVVGVDRLPDELEKLGGGAGNETALDAPTDWVRGLRVGGGMRLPLLLL
jgi:hypothetical protein